MSPTKRLPESSNDDQMINVADTDSIGDVYNPLKGINNALSSPPRKRKRIEDLKVEEPLTPPPSDRPPPWDNKKVSFSDMLKDTIPSLYMPIAEPEQTTSEDIDRLFAEQIAPLATKAERAIEQEQLQEADTTSRVTVPIMDFGRPIAPWDVSPGGAASERERKFMRDINENYLNHPSWRPDAHISRELSWIPFPSSLGRFVFKETIEDDGSLAGFVAEPKAIDPDLLVWKRPGLRILDEIHESDEEELDYGDFPEAKDVRSLIKKRNFELQDGHDDDAEDDGVKHTGPAKRVSSNSTLSEEKQLDRRQNEGESPEDGSFVPEPDFSPVGALDAFLGLRKGELRTERRLTEERPSGKRPKTPVLQRKADKLSETERTKGATFTVPTPQLRIPSDPRFFVASTSLLSNRKLSRQIQSLYPTATIIERDFALYNLRPADPNPSTNLPRANLDTVADEADLILSPSTGLILTSLQKIKQQALPGQAARSPIRERIQRTAAKYEQLVVVVNRSGAQANNEAKSMGDIDESDCEAFASLTAFLNNLPSLSESEVLMIDGDTSVLATWIVSLMIKYSSDVSVKLLQDETQWEVFLRQAGINAFAAQAVVVEMKTMQERDGRPWGLREFVLMKPQERQQRLERILGGRRMLERVGEVLDARW